MWQVVTLAFVVTTAAASVCRTVSLAGGGSHGAYEAGAIWQLVNSLPAEEVQWHVVTGISTGALNTGGAAQWAIGEEKQMADFLQDIWLDLGGSGSVYKDWTGGIVNGLLFQKGLYNTEPLRHTLETRLTRGFNREFIVGATDLNSGVFKNFDQKYDAPLDAIMASAAPPLFFPYIMTDNSVYADGGCVINLDVFAGISRCLELTGGNEADVVVDMIFDSYIDKLAEKDTSFSVLEVYTRVNSINGYDNAIWYYYSAVNAYPKANFRYTIIPSRGMPGGIVPLNFDQAVLEESVQLGKDDTKRILESNPDPRQQAKELFEKNRAKIRYA